MFLSQKQVNLFGVKNVAEREWHRQNRLREPFIKQWELRLKSYYRNLSKEIFDTWQTGSFFLISLDMNKNKTILQNIARVQYTIIANAFKNYALDRMQNVKDFDSEFDRKLNQYIEDNVGTLITDINETTRLRIQNVINNSFNEGLSTEQTGNALRNTILGFGAYRANLIARTETHRTASWANETVAENMNISGTQKEWIAIQDARTRTTHSIASGQRIPLDQKFVVGGERLKYPGDPAGSPGETINCRCSVIYTTPDFLQEDIMEFIIGMIVGFGLSKLNDKYNWSNKLMKKFKK